MTDKKVYLIEYRGETVRWVTEDGDTTNKAEAKRYGRNMARVLAARCNDNARRQGYEPRHFVVEVIE